MARFVLIGLISIAMTSVPVLASANRSTPSARAATSAASRLSVGQRVRSWLRGRRGSSPSASEMVTHGPSEHTQLSSRLQRTARSPSTLVEAANRRPAWLPPISDAPATSAELDTNGAHLLGQLGWSVRSVRGLSRIHRSTLGAVEPHGDEWRDHWTVNYGDISARGPGRISAQRHGLVGFAINNPLGFFRIGEVGDVAQLHGSAPFTMTALYNLRNVPNEFVKADDLRAIVARLEAQPRSVMQLLMPVLPTALARLRARLPARDSAEWNDEWDVASAHLSRIESTLEPRSFEEQFHSLNQNARDMLIESGFAPEHLVLAAASAGDQSSRLAAARAPNASAAAIHRVINFLEEDMAQIRPGESIAASQSQALPARVSELALAAAANPNASPADLVRLPRDAAARNPNAPISFQIDALYDRRISGTSRRAILRVLADRRLNRSQLDAILAINKDDLSDAGYGGHAFYQDGFMRLHVLAIHKHLERETAR